MKIFKVYNTDALPFLFLRLRVNLALLREPCEGTKVTSLDLRVRKRLFAQPEDIKTGKVFLCMPGALKRFVLRHVISNFH